MIKKFISFLKSWYFLDIKREYSCVVCGPDDFNQRENFIKDYIYADILTSNIITTKYLIKSLKIFFKNLEKIKINITNLRFLFLASSIAPVLEEKKIKKVICFIDYYKLGKFFKIILGEKIELIGFQFSVRGLKEKRLENLEIFDQYFLWDNLENNLNQEKNKKIIKFGSLKSYVVLEKNQKWELINKEFEKPRKLILISTVASNYLNFYEKYLIKNNNINTLNKLKIDLKKKNIPLRRDEIQPLDFFCMCFVIKQYISKQNKTIDVIMRSPKDNEKSSKAEMRILKEIFDNQTLNFIQKDFKERVLYSLLNKNEIFLTDCSSLGKELLALKCKVLFISNFAYKFVPFYYDFESVFCSKNNENDFDEGIKKLENLDLSNFNKEIKKTKKTFCSFTPTRYNLQLFQSETNLRLN